MYLLRLNGKLLLKILVVAIVIFTLNMGSANGAALLGSLFAPVKGKLPVEGWSLNSTFNHNQSDEKYLKVGANKLFSQNYAPGEVLVKFRRPLSGKELGRIKNEAGLADILKTLGPKDQKDIYLIKLRSDQSVLGSIEKLVANPNVLFAEPNYARGLTYTPRDPYFSIQWGLHNSGRPVGGTVGSAGADIDAPEAWDIERGGSNPVTVAVIDSGIDLNHPDLAGKLWRNEGEVTGNGIDDDSNGYVDDVNGYSFTGISQPGHNNYWFLGHEANKTNTVFEIAQSIKGTARQLTHIGVMLAKIKSPGEGITISVRRELGGTDLAFFNVEPKEVGVNPSEIYKELSTPVNLAPGATYFIVVSSSNGGKGGFYQIYDNSAGKNNYIADPFRDGNEYRRSDYSWHAAYADDLFFKTNPSAVPRDDVGHGTHVSGIIGAAADNGIGIAGVSFGARIMSVKALDSAGYGYLDKIIDAIYYAVDNGAKIINMSFAGSSYSLFEQAAVNYASKNGATMVAGLGNGGGKYTGYPAGYSNVIGVGATTNQDKRADFSNYNMAISVSAPGEKIYSTMPTYAVAMSSKGYSQNYGFMDGTSMAAPFVSGLAALLLSRNPALSPDQVGRFIEHSADDLGSPGWDEHFGHGRVNARGALLKAGESKASPVPVFTPALNNSGIWPQLSMNVSRVGELLFGDGWPN